MPSWGKTLLLCCNFCINSYFSANNMSEINDLEQALLIAAADADSRNVEEQNSPEEPESEKIHCKEADFYKSISKSPEEPAKVEPVESNEKRTSPSKKESPRSQKRKLETEDSSDVSAKSLRGYANVVATHYNQLAEKGLGERSKSRIIYLRNFHNWIKSMLINEYLTKIKDGKKHNAPLRVLDMCCGKGGDLLKWKKGNITHLICADIASVSLDQCRDRYEDMKQRGSRDRSGGSVYTIEYIPGDCTRVRLREKFSDPSMKLDLVSCQFSFHYCFESLPQAECMLRNASECLQPGGFFIGTMPDAYDLITRARKNGSNTFGNEVYEVTLDFDTDKPELFGAKYHFHLDGVVNCPEFLVHFPTLVKLAKKFGLKFVRREKFHEFFERMKNEGRYLMNTMRALETFPCHDSGSLVGTEKDDYTHASEYLKGKDGVRIGTLSKSEWEASSLYTTFVFEKVKNTWDKNGTPIYDI
nr:mRNA cap guanine-N7 methyltransferase [Leptinotarsa decemlineata]